MSDAQRLGLIGYFTLAMQQRLAKDASLCPTVDQEIALGGMSARAWENYQKVSQVSQNLGVDLTEEMKQYMGLTVQLEERLRPTDWYERLVKSYVTIGAMSDFNRSLTGGLSSPAQAELSEVSWDCGQEAWAAPVITQACATQVTVPARLSLWGRRVLGDVRSTFRQAIVGYPELTAEDGEDIPEAIKEHHRARMERTGLKA